MSVERDAMPIQLHTPASAATQPAIMVSWNPVVKATRPAAATWLARPDPTGRCFLC
jgi:hypothetical protein